MISSPFKVYPKLELACFNEASAVTADRLGADRIEMCEGYHQGGITPDFDLVKKLTRTLSTPIFVMIRPRSGDFVYTDAEFAQMQQSVKTFLSLPVQGFVFGICTPESEVDCLRNTELVQCAAPLPCTFHRAFDRLNNPEEALEQLIACGFKTILSSGQAVNALSGSDKLSQWVMQAGNRIDIMPGGGIRAQHLSALALKTRAPFYHSSAITNSGDQADPSEVAALKKALLQVQRDV